MDDQIVFQYNYSAANHKEIQAIRDKYLPREESKIDELRRLDRTVQSAGMIQALSVGILGCLVFGLGLCLAMQVTGNVPALGVVLGIFGAVIMGSAYPVYRSVFDKTKEKYKPRILALAAQLSGSQD